MNRRVPRRLATILHVIGKTRHEAKRISTVTSPHASKPKLALPDPETSGITLRTHGPEGMRATLRCTTATVEGKHMLKIGD